MSLFLLAGVLLVQAHGFVSFENNNKIILWDPVKLADKGLKMSSAGVNDLENVEEGIIKIQNKDVFIRKFMAFECNDYPVSSECTTMIGNTGGDTFLKIGTLKGGSLLLNSNAGFELNLSDGGLRLIGKVFVDTGKNLVATNAANLPEDTGSAYTDILLTNEIQSLGNLEFPGLKFQDPAGSNPGAKFLPERPINLNFL